jgi:S-DNA-T family DNA segregation ATPase FtsK/SpoIIIE
VELWLRVAPASGTERDVAVDAHPRHTVADLARELGLPADGPVVLDRTGEWLEPGLALDAAGIRSGDVLRADAPHPQPHPRPGQWCLVVAGGPSAGRVVPLAEGETVIGRSPQSDVALEDPNLSRRHLRVTVTTDTVQVADEGSSNGTFVHGARVEARTTLTPGTVIEAGDTALRLQKHTRDVVPGLVREGRVHFSRPPRLRPPRIPPTHRIPAPPEEPVKRRIPLASALVPLVAAPIVAQSAGPAGYLVAALSPVMVGASHWEERRSGRKEYKTRLAAFNDAVRAEAAAMAGGLQQESINSWADHPDVAELSSRAAGPSSRLWERRVTDPDFLSLRIGWADQPSAATWTMPDGGVRAAREAAAAVLNAHTVVPSTPVVVDLVESSVVGIAGAEERVSELARWLVAQAAVLHSPRDLVVAVAVSERGAAAWDWTAWLPHARPEAVPFSAHPLAFGDDEARGLIASLTDLMTARTEQARARSDADGGGLPCVLLVLDERVKVPRASVAALLEGGPAVGLRVIWLGSRTDNLPGETRTIVDARQSTLTVTDVVTGRIVPEAQPDRFTLTQAGSLARSLAGVQDATARSRGIGQLPTYVSLPDLLGGDPSADGVQAAWQRHDGSLAAPVGLSETGPFTIDMRRDGPHALLGGTTGAGKSEMLQTLVASLAAHIPPTRLTFLLVDYKGGAAFKDCVQLPHVVGFVTDLDSHLVHRALVSLNAELHRRERVLAAAGAKDLIEMERKAPDDAPASLLLVVDEFATLAKELPEFVDGVVNVAQRGRSLGIHMLLATQRPAGAINDNIRANTNLRMALRMNDEADSQDVINAKSAAALPRSLPGRAFVRTGASELTEVQIGYAGGHSLAGGDATPLRVNPLRRGLVERPQATTSEVNDDDDRPTDLQRVVALIGEAHAALALPEQPAPWLPPLPDVLPLAELDRADASSGTTIGLLDVPARQAQEPYVVDLAADGSLLVFGASGSGKTTLLRTLALSLAESTPADRLHIYALDFASRGLGSLESLPHCGAVINGDDVERAQRLFGMLERSIAERKRLFGEVGCSSLEEYQRIVGDAPLPRVVVMLDSYGGFASVFDKIDYGARLESFSLLLSEGRPLGIHFVVTADRPTAVPLAVLSSVPARIVLRLADPDDYGMVGLDARVARQASLAPGRGFDQRTLELQVALVGADPAGDAQAKALASAGELLGGAVAGGPASIGTLPREVDLAPLLKLASPLRPVIGIGDRELSAAPIDLQDGHFLVAGPNRSGKSTALAAIASGLRAADPGLELYLLAPRRTPLLSLDIWTATARGAEAIDALCQEIQTAVKSREGEDNPIVVIVDDGHELADSVADSCLESIVRAGRDVAAYVVGASEISAAQRSYGGWIPEVRKDRHGLLLQPDPELDGDLLGARLPKGRRLAVAGRGILVTRYGIETVQVAAD